MHHNKLSLRLAQVNIAQHQNYLLKLFKKIIKLSIYFMPTFLLILETNICYLIYNTNTFFCIQTPSVNLLLQKNNLFLFHCHQHNLVYVQLHKEVKFGLLVENNDK